MNNEEIHKLDMKSKDIVEDNISKISKLFPECISEGKIDFDMLKQELSKDIMDSEKERYQLTWAGKKEAIVNANIPCNKTLRPVKEKSVDFDKTKNIYIEGDNLEVLKILQESYLNKIKCIYIDPPYNTGKDFVYNDIFSRESKEELMASGRMDEEGNILTSKDINNETSGKYHSLWLNMIYPRLKISRNLLTEDGLIFISINDIEVANLKKICDEIFGEFNFVAQIVWTNKEGGGGSDTKLIKVKHEYILCYAKNAELAKIKGVKVNDSARYTCEDKWVETRGKYQLVKLDSASLGYVASLDYPIEAPDGTMITPNKDGKKISRWRWGKEKLEWGRKNDFLEFKKDKNGNWAAYSKQYLNADTEGNIVERTNRPFAIIDKYSSTQASKQLQELLGGKYFNYSKPKDLIKFLLEISTDKNDIILDYFSGSATTAHATLELNSEDSLSRKFIMIQMPEKIEEKEQAFKDGYITICDIGENRIKKAVKKINNYNIDYGFRVYRVDSSNMKDVYYTPTDLQQSQLNMLESNIKGDRTSEDLLTQVILDLGLTLDLSIEERKIINNNVYFVENNSLVACFDDTIDINIVDEICKCNPLKIVFKESSFKTDSDKINVFERIKKLSNDTEINII